MIVIPTSDFRVVITRDNRVICDTKSENKVYITRDNSVISDTNSSKQGQNHTNFQKISKAIRKI